MSLSPDISAQATLADGARQASTAQALASRVNAGQSPKKPEKAFGKILESVTPEKAEQAGASPEMVKTLTSQAQNQRFSPGPTEEKKLRDACEGFESVFIGQLIKEMRKTVPKDGLMHSKYEDEYVSMFDSELAKTLTKQGGVGLADFMQRQIAATATAKTAQPGVGTQKGLRSFASDTMTLPAGKNAQQGLRDRVLNPLRQNGLSGGPGIIPASETVRPGMPMRPPVTPLPGAGPVPAGSLQGTPSQHLGTPGAQYLKGTDTQLLAQPGGSAAPLAEGEISSGFGWRKDPFTGQRAWHSGVDISAPEGTPVRAWRDGNVVYSGKMHGYGNLVIVEHQDGSRSFYGHNKSNTVNAGQDVKAGQVIAQVGQTGRATGPHLHFEVRMNDTAVDPAKLGGTMLAAAPESERMIPDL